MSKLIGLACTAIFLLACCPPQSDRFLKYKTIEAYEIRPGILMMPRYSADQQVCEIGLQNLHYSPGMIRLDSSLSRKEIDQIVEELVPASEKGPRAKDFEGTLVTQGGHSLTTNTDYENVSIQIYSDASPGQGGITVDDVLATIKWKNRKCH
jgi:hypothetical protein